MVSSSEEAEAAGKPKVKQRLRLSEKDISPALTAADLQKRRPISDNAAPTGTKNSPIVASIDKHSKLSAPQMRKRYDVTLFIKDANCLSRRNVYAQRQLFL